MYVHMQLLLAEHVDANVRNRNGATPLHMARDPSIIQVSRVHGVYMDIVCVYVQCI